MKFGTKNKMSDWIQTTLYANGVMKNKYHIHDAEELAKKKFAVSAKNALYFLQQKPKIKNIGQIKALHKFMFGELYDWAGQYRKGNFSKNGFTFFDYQRFEFAEKNINAMMANHPQNSSLANKDYAELLDAINFMHPFREGHGRSCKIFLSAYAANHGQVIDYPRKNEEMIQAQQEADINRIAQLIVVENTPSKDRAFELLTSLHRMKIQKGKKK